MNSCLFIRSETVLKAAQAIAILSIVLLSQCVSTPSGSELTMMFHARFWSLVRCEKECGVPYVVSSSGIGLCARCPSNLLILAGILGVGIVFQLRFKTKTKISLMF